MSFGIVLFTGSQLGPRAADVVPVCGRQGETWGITEGLVPAMAKHLDAIMRRLFSEPA